MQSRMFRRTDAAYTLLYTRLVRWWLLFVQASQDGHHIRLCLRDVGNLSTWSDALRSGIIRRQSESIIPVIPIQHLPQISNTGGDVIGRIERIADPEVNLRGRHQLHQTLRPFARHCAGLTSRFLPDYRMNKLGAYVLTLAGIEHKWSQRFLSKRVTVSRCGCCKLTGRNLRSVDPRSSEEVVRVTGCVNLSSYRCALLLDRRRVPFAHTTLPNRSQ